MSEIRCSLVMEPNSDANIRWPEGDRWFAWDPEIGIESLRGPREVLSTLRSAWKYLRDAPKGTSVINSYACPLIAEWRGDPWHNVDDMRYMLAYQAWSSPELGGYPEGENAPPEEVPMQETSMEPDMELDLGLEEHVGTGPTAPDARLHTGGHGLPGAHDRQLGERTVAREKPRANYGSSHTRETHRPKGHE